MTMMGWRFMYWVSFSAGAIGVLLGVVLLVRATLRHRSKLLIGIAIALIVAGLGGTLMAAAAGPGGFGRNMMGMGGMGMMGGSRSDVRAAPPASPGAPSQLVKAREFAFSPTQLRVQAGSTVNIVFRNEGSVFHTFTITDLDFELEANGGQTTSGAFRTDRVGTYEYVCSVPGHAQSGMRGRIIVN